MNYQLTVIYRDRPKDDRWGHRGQPDDRVRTVVSFEVEASNPLDAAELAWTRCQNIDTSWPADFGPERSMMAGDLVLVQTARVAGDSPWDVVGQLYEVTSPGFAVVPLPLMNRETV